MLNAKNVMVLVHAPACLNILVIPMQDADLNVWSTMIAPEIRPALIINALILVLEYAVLMLSVVWEIMCHLAIVYPALQEILWERVEKYLPYQHQV